MGMQLCRMINRWLWILRVWLGPRTVTIWMCGFPVTRVTITIWVCGISVTCGIIHSRRDIIRRYCIPIRQSAVVYVYKRRKWKYSWRSSLHSHFISSLLPQRDVWLKWDRGSWVNRIVVTYDKNRYKLGFIGTQAPYTFAGFYLTILMTHVHADA